MWEVMHSGRIRLLKSIYGGYQVNEWQQWFGEFQINLNDADGIKRLFRVPSIPVIIEASIQLDVAERIYLEKNLEEAIEPIVWRNVAGVAAWNRKLGVSNQLAGYSQEVANEVARLSVALREALSSDANRLKVTIEPNGAIYPESNKLMELVFQMYQPQQVGIIDYHSASRSYQREELGSVDLNVRNFEAQRASASLYNWQNKYQGIKSQLVSSYIQEIIARESGLELNQERLDSTMQELFRTFFPDKEYLGVTAMADGSIRFPVKTSVGEHDINELSAGEKEIVYGYLRLRSSAPKHSIILIDEPELHLNPGLLRGMPGFYHRHLGEARDNQLWLVTHSDALLRNSIGNIKYSVFHMSAPLDGVENQLAEVMADDELERATIALVGDLASYQPHRKVILLEGGGNTDFDVGMIQRLFPELARRANLVSAGSKRHVNDLYDVLSATATQVGMVNRFFAIVDRDSERLRVLPAAAGQYIWDRYHIENYLLSEDHIRLVSNELAPGIVFEDSVEVEAALIDSAREVAPSTILRQLRKKVNDQIVERIRVDGDPSVSNSASSLRPAIESSFDRLDVKRRELLDENQLSAMAEEIETEVMTSLTDDRWRYDFPGRDILKRLVNKYLPTAGVTYDAFRMLLISRMASEGYQPIGMKTVLDSILETDLGNGTEH
jgi:AAA domain, putative AbiEii toxin, Type IV TA system